MLERELGVLFDQQHRGTRVTIEHDEPLEEVGDHQRCEPQRRLVEQEQTGSRHQRPGHCEHLLLAPESDPAGWWRRSPRTG